MIEKLREQQAWLVTGSLVILAVVALATALSYTRGVMVPFVVAIFIATMVTPIADFLVIRLKFPHSISVAIVLLVVLVALAVTGVMLIVAVQTVVTTATEYSESFADLADRVLSKLENWEIDELDRSRITGQLKATLPRIATQTAGTALGMLSNGALILIFVVFLLAGRNPLVTQSGVYAEIESKIRRYIATKVAVSAVTGLLVWLILTLFGLRLASLFGMLAFLLNFIPSLGSAVATLLPIPIAVAQFNDIWTVLGVVAVPGLVQMAIGNGIEPKLMGEGLELHPVTILLSLAFWGLLWGVVGMVLAVPFTATIRIILMRFAITEPIGRVLAGELPGANAEG